MRVLTIKEVATGEVSTFQLIRYKQYMANTSFYNRMRDPKSLKDVMNGGYLIVDSPDIAMIDKHVYEEIMSEKCHKNYKIVKPIQIRNHDIIHYKDSPEGLVKKLTFVSKLKFEELVKFYKIHNVNVIINEPNNPILRMDTLYDQMNYAYPGKKFVYLDDYYEIVKIEQSPKNALINLFATFYDNLQDKTTYLKRLVKNLF